MTQAQALMYCTHVCPYCHMAVRLLEARGISFERIYVDSDPDQREEMIRRTGKTSVPQIFIGSTHVGGYRELAQLDRDGGLAPLLAAAPGAARAP